MSGNQELTKSAAAPSNFVAAFDALANSSAQVPAWVQKLRQPAMARFLETGFPNLRQEEWKYTSLRILSQLQFSYPQARGEVSEQLLKPYLCSNEINLVFIDGELSKIHSNVENVGAIPGLKIKSLAEALQQDSEKVRVLLEEVSKRSDAALLNLNQAFLERGAFIEIAKNTVITPVINIVHVASRREQTYALFPNSIIALAAGAEATVVETFLAAQDGDYFVNAAVNITLQERARLNYYKIQAESLNAFHICHTIVSVQRDAQFRGFNLDVGSRLGRNNLEVAFQAKGASAQLDGLYLVNAGQHIDNHTAIDHQWAHCTSTQLYKGILKDGARAVFNGKVFVRRGAQQTSATQMNRNLLLGKNAEIDTKPELQIDADDVKVTHGAAVGQLSAEELFYLQSRGIPKQQAEEMLGRAFVDELINNQEPATVREKLSLMMENFFERTTK